MDDWSTRTWSWPILPWMFGDVFGVRFDVTNTGDINIDGYEVPQVYLGFAAAAGESRSR